MDREQRKGAFTYSWVDPRDGKNYTGEVITSADGILIVKRRDNGQLVKLCLK